MYSCGGQVGHKKLRNFGREKDTSMPTEEHQAQALRELNDYAKALEVKYYVSLFQFPLAIHS